MHAQHAVHQSAGELRRRLAHDRVVQRVRRGERVMDGVPVAEVVLGVEPGDAQRGRERERTRELLSGRTRVRGVEERVDDGFGLVAEEPRSASPAHVA